MAENSRADLLNRERRCFEIMYKSNVILIFTIVLMTSNLSIAGENTVDKTEQIKTERKREIDSLYIVLETNQTAFNRLQRRLDSLPAAQTSQRITFLDSINKTQEERLTAIENIKKTNLNYCAKIAYTELLGIESDIRPATLLTATQDFYTGLGNINSLTSYSTYNNWLSEYQKWYEKKKGRNALLEVINSSVNLIGDIANKVPLYGSIAQTVCSGISSIITSVGGASKDLETKTPAMINLMTTLGQFSAEKTIIDNEWEAIRDELDSLKVEEDKLINDQLFYYGLNKNILEERFIKTGSLSSKRAYLDSSDVWILRTLAQKELSGSKDWMKQVEIFMYRVQSIKLRFGQLTYRMQTNIKRYDSLIDKFSDSSKYLPDVSNKIAGVSVKLVAVKNSFNENFKPQRYIEDASVMYFQ